MKILMVGDVHGNDRFFAQMCKLAVEAGCERLLQLGDFGYWEHYPEGVSFLKWVQRQLAEKGITGYWLDGNHENHPMLRSEYGPGGKKHRPTPEGFWQMRDSLFYLPRGSRWTWDGVDFMAVGGAHSIDMESRTPGKSWWPEETLTEEDIEVASAGGKVDVIVSHDCPHGVEIPSISGYRKYPMSEYNRKMLREIVEAADPYMLIHGHYHDRYSALLQYPTQGDGELLWHNTQIEGLNCDMGPFSESYLIFDTEKFNGSRPNV